ncbi:hypothetical protein Tco_1549406 [Tanacetum coccineum]
MAPASSPSPHNGFNLPPCNPYPSSYPHPYHAHVPPLVVQLRNRLTTCLILKFADLGYSLRDGDGGGGRVWRGKWGPLVAESGEGGGWEEEVRWCDGGGRY